MAQTIKLTRDKLENIVKESVNKILINEHPHDFEYNLISQAVEKTKNKARTYMNEIELKPGGTNDNSLCSFKMGGLLFQVTPKGVQVNEIERDGEIDNMIGYFYSYREL